MQQDDDKKIEWYTLPGRLATVAALAFLYAYWDQIPEKAVALSLFAGFFVIPLLAVEIAIHFYLRKPQREGQNNTGTKR
jgi:hypothetical protein